MNERTASIYAQRPLGFALDVGYRTKGVLDHRQGRFAMGLQVGYFPTLSVPATLPYEIWHLRELNLDVPFGVVPQARFGSVVTSAGDLFLVRNSNVPFSTNSYFVSIGPSGSRVLELDEYTVSGMQMDMLSFTVPVRWYFFRDDHRGPRPFVELGLGADLILTNARYEGFSYKVNFDFNASEISSDYEPMAASSEPLQGAVASTLVLTRTSAGVGAAYRRWELGFRGQWSMARQLELRGQGYEAVRGNLLAIPFLADVANDGQVVAEVERKGALVFARNGLSAGNADSGVSDSKTYNGVSRFWDHATWLLSLSFKLR
ncbi:MAG: hypothetical protein MUE88_06765 [Flavobacteriales bacterium]|nr:hypothetical protein [Flavobacteriales bacterium]